MLTVMLKSKRAPNSFEFVLVKIIIKLHFMKFFYHYLLFTMSKTAENPILTIWYAFKIRAIFGLN